MSDSLWTVACQAPLSMEFSRQEYWSGLPWRPPGDLANPGIELMSPALAGEFLTLSHWDALVSPSLHQAYGVKIIIKHN